MKNHYLAEDDGYGIVGYSFKCIYCGNWTENRFVSEYDEEHKCGKCGKINEFEPMDE